MTEAGVQVENPVHTDEINWDGGAPGSDVEEYRDPSMLSRQVELEWVALYWVSWNPDDIPALDLTPADFTVWQHRVAYRLLTRCYSEGEPIVQLTDWIALRETCTGLRERDAVQYFIDHDLSRNLFLLATPTDKLRSTVLSLKRATYRREAVAPVDPELLKKPLAVVERVRREQGERLEELRARYEKVVVQESLNTLATLKVAASTGVPLGVSSRLDALMGGVPLGDLVTILGSPGVGKTALALEIIKSLVMRGLGCYFASLEMPRPQVLARHIQSFCHVTKEQLRRCVAGEDYWPYKSPEEFDQYLSNYVIANAANTLAKIEAGVKTMKVKPTLVVVDYLGHMEYPGARSATERTEECMRGLKKLAQRMGVAVVVLSQMAKGGEKTPNGPDRCPVVSSGKWSQEIEAASDFVLGMWRPNFVNDTKSGAEKVKAKLAVLKNRHGPHGRVDLTFDLTHQQISGSLALEEESNY